VALIQSLSFHSAYRCRHSGACCTAGWPIPVEARLLPLVGTAILLPDAHGACVHFDRGSHLCRIQRDHGEDALPGSCYQFPRRALIDDRGTFITLSNFCPTAAALLYDSPAPLMIVSEPPAFGGERVYEGLDARGQWPPLVRPGLLFDLGSYSRWEAFLVSTLDGEAPLDAALRTIASTAEQLRAWTPGDGSFDGWLTNSLASPSPDDRLAIYSPFRTPDAYEKLRQFVPEGLDLPPPPPETTWVEPGAPFAARARRRYLACKAFASWAAYEGHGVRTLVAELMISDLVLRGECARQQMSGPLDRARMIEAIRQADLFLIHLTDRSQMIRWLGDCER
jgi:hypothetical protein